MRPYYDDYEEFDFADSAAVARILREQTREQRRFAKLRHRGLDDDDYDLDSYAADDFDASYGISD